MKISKSKFNESLELKQDSSPDFRLFQLDLHKSKMLESIEFNPFTNGNHKR